MKINKISFHIISIPMIMSVRHALAERNVAENAIVLVEDSEGNMGIGECCPRDYVTGETIESVKQNLRDVFIPEALGQTFESFEAVVSWLTDKGKTVSKQQLAAFCSIELALLDLAGHTFKISAGAALHDIVSKQVHYSGVIASDDLQKVDQVCRIMSQFKIGHVKVKLVESLDKNRAILTLAREILGNTELRGDANSAWSADEAINQLQALSEFGLTGIEQPVAGDDTQGMSQVVASKLVPVVADESLCSYDDGVALIKSQGCDVFNLRVSKCGGLIKTYQLYQLAKQSGLKCQLGAQVGETSILSAAGVHMATRTEGLLWLEGCFGKFLMADDITETGLTLGMSGVIDSLDSPGLGVTLNPEKLEQYSIEQQTFTVEG